MGRLICFFFHFSVFQKVCFKVILSMKKIIRKSLAFTLAQTMFTISLALLKVQICMISFQTCTQIIWYS